jgi:hypothetical protein
MPNADSRPTSSEARKAPATLPMPPITTTTKASAMTCTSICRFTASFGICSAPPRPASAEPRNTTLVNSQR